MHLYGQPFDCVLEKRSFTSSFFLVKNAKKNVEDKWFLSKIFSQIKMQAATNWSSHLKKHQVFDDFFFKRQIFNAILKKYVFRDF